MSPEAPIVTVKERDIAVIHALRHAARDQLPEIFTPLQATELIASSFPEIDPETIIRIIEHYLEEVTQTGVVSHHLSGFRFNQKLPMPE